MDGEDFDPESPEARDAGARALDGDDDLGSVVTHLYRAEVDRETSWRQRMDSTTNWAVTVIAGIIAYAFSSDTVAHTIVLVAVAIGIVFLLMEARRFQRYDVWRVRVRSMQQNYFANALDPSAGVEHADWRRQLGDAYRNPQITITFRSALAHRLRRVYLPLLVGLLFVWLVRLNGAEGSILDAASVSSAPGWAVLATVAVAYGCLFLLAFWPGRTSVSELDESTDRGDLESDE